MRYGPPVRRTRFSTRTAAIVVAALTLTACGGSGSSTVSPAAYIKSVCQALTPFKQSQSLGTTLDFSTKESPAQRKQALESFLDSLISDTQHVVPKLKAAGSPKVKNGKNIASGLVLSRYREVYQ